MIRGQSKPCYHFEMRPHLLPLLAALLPLTLVAGQRHRKARLAATRAAVSPVPQHPPGPPPVPAGSGASGISAVLTLKAGAQPLKGLGNRIFVLIPGEPQPLTTTFVSGSGPATKIITLNYRIMKVKPASPAAPLEIELLPPGEKTGRKVTLFADGRSRVVSIWRREFPEAAGTAADEEILLELNPASAGESAAVAWRTPPTVGRTFRIRAQLTQALPAGDKSLESSDFIAPLGDSARAEYENLTVRVEKRATTGSVAPEPLPADGPARSAPIEPLPAEVTVEDHDHLLLQISAEPAENHRLRYTVLVEGRLAALLGEPVPLQLSRVFSGYRHEPAFLVIAAPGGRYQYSLSLDPDWQEEGSETGAMGGD